MPSKHFSAPSKEARRSIAIAITAAFTAGVLGLVAGRVRSSPVSQDHLSYTGTRTEPSPGFAVYSGGASVQPDSIGVMFGPTLRFGATERMHYLVLLKYGPEKLAVNGMHLSSSADGIRASVEAALTINGKPVSFTYKARGDRDGTKFVSETLAFNGLPIHLDKGALLLLDLREKSTTLRQVAIPLPPTSYDDTSGKVELRALSILNTLKQQSTEVRDFTQSR